MSVSTCKRSVFLVQHWNNKEGEINTGYIPYDIRFLIRENDYANFTWFSASLYSGNYDHGANIYLFLYTCKYFLRYTTTGWLGGSWGGGGAKTHLLRRKVFPRCPEGEKSALFPDRFPRIAKISLRSADWSIYWLPAGNTAVRGAITTEHTNFGALSTLYFGAFVWREKTFFFFLFLFHRSNIYPPLIYFCPWRTQKRCDLFSKLCHLQEDQTFSRQF